MWQILIFKRALSYEEILEISCDFSSSTKQTKAELFFIWWNFLFLNWLNIEIKMKINHLLFSIIRSSSDLNSYWSSHAFCLEFLHIITTVSHLSSFDKSIAEVPSIGHSFALLTIVFIGSFPLCLSPQRDIIESEDRIKRARHA
jgi:hypothetical protein